MKKFTEEEKKIRVVERAIRRNWDRHEQAKQCFIEEIERDIRDRNWAKQRLDEIFEDDIKSNDDFTKYVDDEIKEYARRLHRAEMKVFWAKQRFKEIYKEEILLK